MIGGNNVLHHCSRSKTDIINNSVGSTLVPASEFKLLAATEANGHSPRSLYTLENSPQ